MKRRFAIILAIFLFLIYLASERNQNVKRDKVSEKNEVIGYYNGIFKSMYKFTTEENKVLLFEEVEETIEVNLFDENNIGKRFIISWDKKVIDFNSNEKHHPGEAEGFLSILELKELK